LGGRDDLKRQRRLSGGLRAEDLDDSPSRHSAHAERDIERERPGGDRLDVQLVVGAEPHDRALTTLLLDLLEREVERLLPGLRLLLGLFVQGLLRPLLGRPRRCARGAGGSRGSAARRASLRARRGARSRRRRGLARTLARRVLFATSDPILGSCRFHFGHGPFTPVVGTPTSTLRLASRPTWRTPGGSLLETARSRPLLG